LPATTKSARTGSRALVMKSGSRLPGSAPLRSGPNSLAAKPLAKSRRPAFALL
jgi:hypothetical protein